MNPVEAADARREGIAGRHENAIGAGIVEDTGPCPDRVLPRGAGRRRFRRDEVIEVSRLVAAYGVEHSLRAGRAIDRGDVALIIAVVPGIAGVRDIQVLDTGRGGNRQRRRAFFVVTLERGELRPSSGQYLDAIADLILVDVPVQSIRVDIETVGIDGRRGRRIAGAAAAVVYRAGSRAVLVTPHDGAVLRVQRDDLTVAGGDEQEVLDATRRRHVFEEDRRAVDEAGQGDLVLDGKRADVGGGEDRFGGVQ